VLLESIGQEVRALIALLVLIKHPQAKHRVFRVLLVTLHPQLAQ
jgi:hypothetical protein